MNKNIIIILFLLIGISSAQLETSTSIQVSDGTLCSYFNMNDMSAVSQGSGSQVYESASSISCNESLLEISYILDGVNEERTNRFMVELDAANVGILHNVDMSGFDKINSDAYLESTTEDNLTSIYSDINIIGMNGKSKGVIAKVIDGKLQDQERFYINNDGLFNISVSISEDCFDVPGEGNEDWLSCNIIGYV